MKKKLAFYILILFASCRDRAPLVGPAFADSLQSTYSSAQLLQSNDREIRFWKHRIDTSRPGEINESRYAGALIARFRCTGLIGDVFKADSIYTSMDCLFQHRLPGPLLHLASTDILTHHFSDADTTLEQAKRLGIERYIEHYLSFDVLFELGQWQEAAFHLRSLQPYQDYNYYFRKAKYEHLLGHTDSALTAIRNAAALATNPGLKALALSNEGDLLLHTGRFPEAAQALKSALHLNPADLHTLLGIGWIALIHDRDTTTAAHIFRYAANSNALPDAWFKLYQLQQWRKDTTSELYFARSFAARASREEYGRMYNKYLLELYTGILHAPEKAECIAHDELKNRRTPQTFTWYAFALLCNHKQEQAYQVFKDQVSGKPLEAVELFYCGKVLKAVGKGYDANAYFEAALNNGADLSPAMIADIRQSRD